MGGPMMGFPLNTLEVPMMKGSNGIIAIDTDETKEQPCNQVRTLCGRMSDGTFSSVFRKICERRELAGHEGHECHGLC